MEKLSLSKLIANDIVNYGMDKTTSFNYIVSLNDFLDDYDDETINYIKSHINEIIDDVHQNENVAQLDYDEKRQEFDMVFYYDELLTPLEKEIANKAKEMGYEFEIDELRGMSYQIKNLYTYNELVEDQIKNNIDHGKEI